ncbi:hypothetical protein MUK42_27048 [Musa troglodytarum]|uniref:Uncharacterized protein n=1 Tax=Musa troglodytarum TaxID=320322 RepID=A0A9E7F6M3_9LILI|nr:hypothetical protein MUK42_27048 [Musa troglodytarum]
METQPVDLGRPTGNSGTRHVPPLGPPPPPRRARALTRSRRAAVVVEAARRGERWSGEGPFGSKYEGRHVASPDWGRINTNCARKKRERTRETLRSTHAPFNDDSEDRQGKKEESEEGHPHQPVAFGCHFSPSSSFDGKVGKYRKRSKGGRKEKRSGGGCGEEEMGRGRVELKRIENKINRQVTFSKRRNGLLKKAYELSVLCDAEIALIIFSSRGKLFEFASSEITKTIERYQSYQHASQLPADDQETQARNTYQEISKLKAKYESLQRSHRHLLGEDLGPLSLKELQQLERQLESALSQARQRRTQLMLDHMEELQKRERNLEDINRQLKFKLEAETSSLRAIQGSWEPNAMIESDPFSFRLQPNTMECEPTLQMYHHFVPPEAATPGNTGGENTYMLGWGHAAADTRGGREGMNVRPAAACGFHPPYDSQGGRGAPATRDHPQGRPRRQAEPADVVSRMPTQNPEAVAMVDRILCLLAAYGVVSCSVETGDDGQPSCKYGAAPGCNYLTNNEDGVSLAAMSLMNQDNINMIGFASYYLNDTVLEGGVPFQKAYGMTVFEHHGTDPRFNKLFNECMRNHSTILMKKLLDT